MPACLPGGRNDNAEEEEKGEEEKEEEDEEEKDDDDDDNVEENDNDHAGAGSQPPRTPFFGVSLSFSFPPLCPSSRYPDHPSFSPIPDARSILLSRLLSVRCPSSFLAEPPSP